ncbi:UNVERIFIED_CONTAM: hypothetical protein FKN15_051037 [Acipenser sinensis]
MGVQFQASTSWWGWNQGCICLYKTGPLWHAKHIALITPQQELPESQTERQTETDMDMIGKDLVRMKAKTVINEAAKGAQGVVDNMMGGGQKKPGTGSPARANSADQSPSDHQSKKSGLIMDSRLKCEPVLTRPFSLVPSSSLPGDAGGGVGGLLSNLAKPAQDAVMGAMQDSGTKQTENAAVDPLKLAKSFF